MIYTHLVAALIAAGLAFTAGWQVRAWKAGHDDLQRVEAEQSDAAKRALHVDAAAEANQVRTAEIREQVRTITREVEHVVEKPVYRDVCLDDDGLRLIARAAGAGADSSQPAPALPGSAAAR